MKLIIFFLFFSQVIFAQATIGFDNIGYNSNQKIAKAFVADGFTMESNKYFYTNYGKDFDIYSLSIYYVWEDTETGIITLSSEENGIITFVSINAYQVSETVIDYELTVEGWNDTELRYTKSFTDVNIWDTLDLNYDEVNRIVIKFNATNPFNLIDFNFDDFTFIYGKRDIRVKL